jgi:hypothetical protein
MRCDLARTPSETEAAHIVAILIGSYPSKGQLDAETARVYSKQLRELIMAYPLSVARELTSPHTGVVAQCVGYPYPSVADVKRIADVLADRKEERFDLLRNELKWEEDRAEEVSLSPEERGRRADTLQKLAQTMRETAKALTNTKHTFKPIQEDCRHVLLTTDLMLSNT